MARTRQENGEADALALRVHKATGQAYYLIDGQRHYVGKAGRPETQERARRFAAEYRAGGRQVPKGEITVNEIAAAFLRFAQEYHRGPDGNPTDEMAHLKTVLKVLAEGYGRTPAVEFGPLALKACRQAFIDRGQARRTVNQNTQRLKRIFRWAVENEMVPGSVFHALQAVAGLRHGRCSAPEPKRVEPVQEDVVEATLPHVSAAVGAMIRVQLLTGMRPGEVTGMRGSEIDRSAKPWVYRPRAHKTAHLGHERIVHLGPQSQAILEPFLADERDGYLFSPAEAEEARNAARTLQGPTARGSRGRKAGRARPWGDRYDVDSYRRAIQRACAKVTAQRAKDGMPPLPCWGPHRLRHTRATQLRAKYGIEGARLVLGHRSAAITEIYAEVDRSKAAEIMAEVG